MDLKETDILGANIQEHWYYKTKAMAMTTMIKGNAPQNVLDVGAGSGFFSRHLLEHTTARLSCCVDISYSNDSDETHHGKAIQFRRFVGDVCTEIVLFMDVLEHVDDDLALLEEYIKKVPLGTRFLITVPAFNFLWSGHDEFLEHRRRYTLTQLERVVRKSGLTVIAGNYFFGIIFPIVVVTRFLQKIHPKKIKSQLSKHHPFTNYILTLLCKLELPFMRFNRIAGLSIFCVAQKLT